VNPEEVFVMSDGLLITGHAYDATCIACARSKECFYVESPDGMFNGPICVQDLKKFVRLRHANRPQPDRGTPLFDGNGPTNDREVARA
jgi:hypothetical protein